MTLRSSSTMIFDTFKQRTGNRRRNLSLGSLCLGSVCIGLTMGWPESLLSHLLLIDCGTSCYNLKTNGAPTVQMIINCGSCIGALVPTCIADTYGRRSSFAIAGLLNLAYWSILIGLRGYLEIIFVAAIGGIATGIFVTTTALYVSEISLPRARGTTGALVAFCSYFGALFGGCFMFFAFKRTLAIAMTCLAMIFLASLHWWMIESPYFLFLRGKTLDAKLSLKALRGARTVMEIDPEYKTIELIFHIEQNDSKLSGSKRACFLTTVSRKQRYATVVIIFLCVTQMVVAYGMNDYTETLLNVLLPNYGRVIISLLDVLSVAICLWVIEKFDKKHLLLVISVIGSSASCLILAIFTLIAYDTKNQREYYDSSIILSATLLTLYYMIYILGLAPILPVFTGEIFPSRFKTVALGCCVSFIYLSSMMIQFIFELLNDKQGSNLAFACFAIFGALGIPFALAFLPETRGFVEFEEYTIILS